MYRPLCLFFLAVSLLLSVACEGGAMTNREVLQALESYRDSSRGEAATTEPIEISTEFTLVAQSEVADAFDRALKALPGAECTEENCLVLLQQYLRVSLVFNLQVVQDEDAGLTQLSLSLTEGRRRTVRTELCESCSLKGLLNSLDKVTGTLLLERRRDRQVAQAKPGIGVEPETLELREGGVSGTLAVSVQSPLGGKVVLGLESDPAGLGFQPSRLLRQYR